MQLFIHSFTPLRGGGRFVETVCSIHSHGVQTVPPDVESPVCPCAWLVAESWPGSETDLTRLHGRLARISRALNVHIRTQALPRITHAHRLSPVIRFINHNLLIELKANAQGTRVMSVPVSPGD